MNYIIRKLRQEEVKILDTFLYEATEKAHDWEHLQQIENCRCYIEQKK